MLETGPTSTTLSSVLDDKMSNYIASSWTLHKKFMSLGPMIWNFGAIL